MKRLLRRIYTVRVFIAFGRLIFSTSKVGWLEPVTLRLARFSAWLVRYAHGHHPQASAEALATEWNRLMPTPRDAFPLLRVEEDTAYVEIRITCPLRGSGDAEACWRAMEFDRALMDAVGGQLVVMTSQSVTGGACCSLAIRPAGADLSDLPVAHPRWRRPPGAD